jgi:glycosyltransferase involved in cell wall biosynthesis
VPEPEKPLPTSTQNPQVSVIIPSYNTAGLIRTCLDSVFQQSYRDLEAIVVNDGSPDTPQLEEALQPYLDRIVYIRQENKRCAGARNTAIRRARGKYLAFLDSDDAWVPNHLASQMNLFEQDPSLDMVYSDAILVSDGKREKAFTEICPSMGEATFEALILERCQIPVSTVVARKDAIERAGMFDENLVRCDDYDMWIRTAFHGAKIGYSGKPQARLYAGRPDSLGLSRAKMAEADWKILEKAATGLPLSQKQAAIVRNRAAEIRARYLLEEGKIQLQERQPEKARELFTEANRHLRRLKLSMMIRGLQFAPQSTCSLLGAWNRWRSFPAG